MADDRELAARVLEGERDAFRLLVERHQRRVFAIIRALCGVSECEDLAQETFLAAYRNLARFDHRRASFATWLAVIARRRALNWLQKKRPQTVAHTPDVSVAYRPEGRLEREEFERRLDEALAQLPEEQRTCFVLADIDGRSVREISQIENVSEGTVKSRLHRARQRLRAAVDRQLREDS